MKQFIYVLCIGLLIGSNELFAQSMLLDDRKLSLENGTTQSTDPTALNNTVLKRDRYYNNPHTTAWYGPYTPLQAGSYLVQVRLKVSDNSSNVIFGRLDLSSNTTGVAGYRDIRPSDFYKAGEWQIFEFVAVVPSNVTDIEARCMDFKYSYTDLYVDYISLTRLGEFSRADFFVTGSGNSNVGIGTFTPQAKLAVNGDILCQKIKVSKNGWPAWPDYVFDCAYKLRPLNELDQYIQQYHHLPEVPSAKEMDTQDLDVAGNQVTLLKKIEELTLYVIEQNKKIEEQHKKQELQTQEIQELKQKIQLLQQTHQ
jgi:hypothetical protein